MDIKVVYETAVEWVCSDVCPCISQSKSANSRCVRIIRSWTNLVLTKESMMQCKCRVISGHNHCNYFRHMTFGSSLFDQSCNWDVNIVGRNTIANFTTNTSWLFWANVTRHKTPLLDIKLSWCGQTTMTIYVTVFWYLQQMMTISFQHTASSTHIVGSGECT